MPKKDEKTLKSSHGLLASIMPLGCCWLDDGEGQPCMDSVAFASSLSMLNLLLPWGMTHIETDSKLN
mgnify:CR=1 FL=1